jgi:hypothetical protein
MNSYTIISIKDEKVVVDFTINNKTQREIMDANYLPVADALELDTELSRQLKEMVAVATVEVIPNEVIDLVGVEKELTVKEESIEVINE